MKSIHEEHRIDEFVPMKKSSRKQSPEQLLSSRPSWLPWVLAGICVGGGVGALSYLGPNTQPSSDAKSATKSEQLPAGYASTIVNSNKPKGQRPKGMVWIPGGEFSMGSDYRGESLCGLPGVTSDAVPIHRVYVDGFWMDETEITNNEYRQFVFWVKDSIALKLLGDATPEDYLIQENEYGEPYDPPFLNWKASVDYEDQATREVLQEMYLPEHERFYRIKQIDTRKLNFQYYWIDLKAAARKDFSAPGNNEAGSLNNRPQGLKDRSVYIRKEVINVYPDTLAWVHDYAYS
ncbi:MAG: SUMF1/EgtB/PvdO family nonheme iron enzyme, partial [Planctomycetota bacterium]